jgi:hypothetical protein
MMVQPLHGQRRKISLEVKTLKLYIPWHLGRRMGLEDGVHGRFLGVSNLLAKLKNLYICVSLSSNNGRSVNENFGL